MKWYFRPAYAYAFATAGNTPIAPAKPKYMDNLMFYGPGGRSVGGRLYHGPYDPGLPGAGYNSLEPKKADHNKKPNVFVRIRDWWYFHTHEL